MSEAFPRTPEEIADDYFARRGGILRALTDGEPTQALADGAEAVLLNKCLQLPNAPLCH